jgi:hypothetical protein
MYWNNPLVELHWPNASNPVAQSFHDGAHCLFYNPDFAISNVSTNQRLHDLCDWANHWLQIDGIQAFAADSRNHYDIANLVKLNMWVTDIRSQGIVKPWMILDQGDGTFLPGTGDSRLRCLECIPEIQTVPAFVSTRSNRAHLYSDLEPVTTFDQFAKLCGAEPGQVFLFRFTDKSAAYGICWYEYASPLTRSVTPDQNWCVNTFVQYAQQHPELSITKQWFNKLVDWQTFAE